MYRKTKDIVFIDRCVIRTQAFALIFLVQKSNKRLFEFDIVKRRECFSSKTLLFGFHTSIVFYVIFGQLISLYSSIHSVSVSLVIFFH